MLVAKQPIHRSLSNSLSLKEINEALKRFKANITIKPLKVGNDIQRTFEKLTGWSRYKYEKLLPGHNFSGVGTNLDKRLNPDNTPRQDSMQ